MKVGIPKELRPGETRVAAVPETVKQMVAKGHTVVVEAGAGAASHVSDAEYTQAGATVVASHAEAMAAQVVLKVNKPALPGDWDSAPDEVAQLAQGGVVISYLAPYQSPKLMAALAARNVTAFSMEMVPRISRAQSMDALSSQASIAGYKAVLMAAEHLPRLMPMMMTAAGTIQPARGLVLGAGVAGLQAIATLRRLGAVVEAFDTRAVVKDQVESLGARFVTLEVDAAGEGGYAKELTEEHHKKELELIASRTKRTDVVITTAAIPGKRSPVLITAQMVADMRPGSVIVDLAAEGGGNCELTEAGKVVVKHGVTLVGTLNIPALMPDHASQMYARNVLTLFNHLATPNGLKLELTEDITKGAMVTHSGAVVHPALQGK